VSIVPAAPETVFDAVGESGISQLVRAFYAQVPNDEILGPMYPKDDLVAAEIQLRDFLIYRFGGPDRYLATRGNPRLRMRHAPFVINQVARDRWLKLMRQALHTLDFPAEVSTGIDTFFSDTASFLINSH
jgi:hemoglobin